MKYIIVIATLFYVEVNSAVPNPFSAIQEQLNRVKEVGQICNDENGLNNADAEKYLIITPKVMNISEGCFMYCFAENMGFLDGAGIDATKVEEILNLSPATGTKMFDKMIANVLRKINTCNQEQKEVDNCEAAVNFIHCLATA